MSLLSHQESFNVPCYDSFDKLLQFIVSFNIPQTSIAAFKNDQLAMQNLLTNITNLKLLGRNPELSKQFQVNHIDALVNNIIAPHFSFEILQEAFSVIANALLINTDLLSTWHAGNAFKVAYNIYADHAISKNIYDKERFILRRVGFLITYSGTTIDEEQVIAIADLVCVALHRVPNDILKLYRTDMVNAFSKNSIIELLKICFNLLHNYPSLTSNQIHAQGGMTNIAQGLVYTTTLDPEYADLTRYLLNCLLNSTSTATWFDVSNPDEEPTDFRSLPPPQPDDFEKTTEPGDTTRPVLKHVNCAALLTRILDYALVATDPKNKDKNLLDDACFTPCLTALEQIIHKIYVKYKDQHTPKLEQLRRIAEGYLLPSDNDRKYPLGSTEAPHSLPHAFTRFSSTIGLQTCTTLVHDIYWKLSHENQEELVQNMGFGFASAYMSPSSILFGGAASSSLSKTPTPPPAEAEKVEETKTDSSVTLNSNESVCSDISTLNSTVENSSTSLSRNETTTSEDYNSQTEEKSESKITMVKNKLKAKAKSLCPNSSNTEEDEEELETPKTEPQQQQQKEINPITGQYISYEQLTSKMAEIQMSAQKRAQEGVQQEEEWTEEEKEREAEKMFVLFERLKKNGIIKVANPVELYQQQGRFENIS